MRHQANPIVGLAFFLEKRESNRDGGAWNEVGLAACQDENVEE